jgi:transcriptional regulator with XRE-family HTH domain
MLGMPRDAGSRELLQAFATVVRTSRRARRWTQRQLAAALGVAQSHVVRIERAQEPDLSFFLAGRALEVLGGRLDVRFIGAPGGPAPQRDRAHARCVAYVARQLERAGFTVATEVEVGEGRWRVFADVLAFHPRERVLLVIEVKTEIHEVGDIDRQIGIAERGASDAAGERGWRPRAVAGLLLILATVENDRRLADNRPYFDHRYRRRARDIQPLLDGLPTDIRRGERGLAMIDPATRRRAWLLAAAIDGRRAPARYPDRAGFLRARR